MTEKRTFKTRSKIRFCFIPQNTEYGETLFNAPPHVQYSMVNFEIAAIINFTFENQSGIQMSLKNLDFFIFGVQMVT